MSEFATSAIATDDLAHVFEVVGAQSWRALTGQHVFITGGTGFVGKWLLAALLYADRRLGLRSTITLLSRDPDRFATTAPELARSSQIKLLRGDVRHFDFPPGRFDAVIHAATDVGMPDSPRTTFTTCVGGTARVLEFASQAGATTFLLVSSGAVYGRQPPQIERVDELYLGAPDPLLPSSAYGEGKRAAEWLSCAHSAETALQVKIARCFAFVGPYLPLDQHFAIGNFLRDAMAGREIVVQGDGTPCRSYLYAADMAAWLWAVLLRGKVQTAYNVGGSEVLSVADVAHRVADVLSCTAGVRILKTATIGLPPERYVPDTARARIELSLPAAICLDDAITRTVRWYRGNGVQPIVP